MGERTEGTESLRFRDPCPVWDGESPAERWRAVRRAVVLWSEDTDLVKSKHGGRFFRSLTGKAAALAECLSDDTIRAADGLQKILEYFDELYAGYLAIAQDRDVEDAIYGGQKKAAETFISYCQRKVVEFKRYEVAHGVLPDEIRGKVLLRQA
eukprot:6059048-Amphidinium_carterae.1